MHKNERILALVPARGGSKGLFQKNIIPLLGKPLIAWTIERAKASKYIDRIIVSTDDEKIAQIAQEYGAEVPFIRPRALANDESRGICTVLHALGKLREQGHSYDVLVLLQPTCPLRAVEDIDASIELLFENEMTQAVVSVCVAEHHPYWTNILPEDGCMKGFIRPAVMNKNRQEFPRFYRLNGAVYVGYCEQIQKQEGFFGKKTFAYIMPPERSVDIDNEIDLLLAEVLLQREASA